MALSRNAKIALAGGAVAATVATVVVVRRRRNTPAKAKSGPRFLTPPGITVDPSTLTPAGILSQRPDSIVPLGYFIEELQRVTYNHETGEFTSEIDPRDILDYHLTFDAHSPEEAGRIAAMQEWNRRFVRGYLDDGELVLFAVATGAGEPVYRAVECDSLAANGTMRATWGTPAGWAKRGGMTNCRGLSPSPRPLRALDLSDLIPLPEEDEPGFPGGGDTSPP